MTQLVSSEASLPITMALDGGAGEGGGVGLPFHGLGLMKEVCWIVKSRRVVTKRAVTA